MSIQINNVDVIDDGKNIVNAVNSNITGISTSATGCVTGTFTGATLCGGTVCATTGFAGDGSSLTNLTAANIPGLPALIPSGATVCTYTSSTTWTKPGSVSVVFVELWGAGGGGGGGNYNTCPNTGYGGGQGGGGGGYTSRTFSGSEIPGPVSITIGSGGAGGSKCGAVVPNPYGYTAIQASPGSPGGNTCFGTIFCVGGGCGGQGCPASCPTYAGCIFSRGGSSYGSVPSSYCVNGIYLAGDCGGYFSGAANSYGSFCGGSGGGSGGGFTNCVANGWCQCSYGNGGGTPGEYYGGGGAAGTNGPGCSTPNLGAGGGGGGRSGAAPGTGCPGGNGTPRGGGGGGGGGMQGTDAGNGGTGGDGYARVIFW